MLSAAARPRWIAALMPDSAFSRSSSVSSATTYDANVPRSRPPVSLCASATQMMTPTAIAASVCVSGELAALADDCLVIDVAQRVGRLDGARALVRLAAEHAHDPVAADHLLEHVRHRAGARLHVARDAAQPAAEVADDDGDDRQHDERHQRQPPVDPQQPAEARDDRQRAADRGRDRARRCRRELVRVERDLRLDDAGGRARRSRASAAAAACRSARAAGRTRRDGRCTPSRTRRCTSRGRGTGTRRSPRAAATRCATDRASGSCGRSG